MALTPEQQAEVDKQVAIATAIENLRQSNQVALEGIRNTAQAAAQAKQAKLDAVRMAKEVLIENARSKPADSRNVTAADITAFAAVLEAHINA